MKGQVRISEAMINDLAIIAPTLGLSVPKYVEQELEKSIARDFLKAAKAIEERAKVLREELLKHDSQG